MKYMGSKNRIKRPISEIINGLIEEKGIKKYVEPFVGGANLIDSIQCENKVGYDKNKYLITMFNALLKGYEPPREISKELYLDIKANKEKYPEELVSVAGFCSTYNAKWFGGYAGKVLTKSGVTRDYYDESVRNIKKQLKKLQDVVFLESDYVNIECEKGSLIYCDPPYEGTTGYGFDNNFDHNSFWQWVREKSIDNIVLVSEYNAPDDFECIFEQKLTTTLDKNSRTKSTEKLFVMKGVL